MFISSKIIILNNQIFKHSNIRKVDVVARLRVFRRDKPDCLRRGSVQLVNDPTQSLPLQTMCQRFRVKLHETTSESPLRNSHASAGGTTSGHPVTVCNTHAITPE